MVATCPKCGGAVGVQTAGEYAGTLFPHQRYVDGSGYGPNQDHTLVQCEGSNKAPR